MEKIVIITGATSVGKSNFALNLAQKFNGEIIGTDSMQIYKGMDIGTSKTPPNQRNNITHHLIDIIEPHQNFSVGEYVVLAKKAITEITKKGKLPILVGGTGLYISSLLQDFSFASSSSNLEIREQLKQKSNLELHEYLTQIDPISAIKISQNDVKRLIRAIEIYLVTGKPKSQHIDQKPALNYNHLTIILNLERQKMYQKIENRVEQMINDGLVAEVKSIYNSLINQNVNLDGLQSVLAIGYKEIIAHLKNECSLDKAIELIKTNTRHYAKRQVTYFKNMPIDKHFFDIENPLTLSNTHSLIDSLLNNTQGEFNE